MTMGIDVLTADIMGLFRPIRTVTDSARRSPRRCTQSRIPLLFNANRELLCTRGKLYGLDGVQSLAFEVKIERVRVGSW